MQVAWKPNMYSELSVFDEMEELRSGVRLPRLLLQQLFSYAAVEHPEWRARGGALHKGRPAVLPYCFCCLWKNHDGS